MSGHDAPFYGKKIARDQEADYIQSILSKYQNEVASDELKEKVYNELMKEKYLGNVTIPFRVVMQRDESGMRPDYIDVLLDTKV